MPLFTLMTTQKLATDVETLWDFISSPKNLEKITPPSMGFAIVTPDLPEKMYPGVLIAYDVKPLWGLKMRWVSEITHIVHLTYFIDVQRMGPYRFWHHQHHVEAIPGGVIMRDIVHYQPPLGWLGAGLNRLVIHRQLTTIFEYRRRKMDEIFGGDGVNGYR